MDTDQQTTRTDRLRAEFRNSFPDQLLFQAYVNLRSPVFLLAIFGLALAIVLPLKLDGAHDFIWVLTYATMTLLVAAGLFLAQMVFVVVWVLVHRDQNFYRPRSIVLSDRSVVDETAVSRYEVQWLGIHGVLRTPWCLYIRLTPLSAHCVPPRAFADRRTYRDFADEAVRLFRRSRKGDPA